MDVVDWSGREVGRLLTRFIHTPEIAESLTRLRGTWPFNATAARCKAINTRDTAYRDIAVQGFISDTIRYDSVYLTCSKKLTDSQLSLPHGTNKNIKEKKEK